MKPGAAHSEVAPRNAQPKDCPSGRDVGVMPLAGVRSPPGVREGLGRFQDDQQSVEDGIARRVGLRVGDPGIECAHGGADPRYGVLDLVEALRSWGERRPQSGTVG